MQVWFKLISNTLVLLGSSLLLTLLCACVCAMCSAALWKLTAYPRDLTSVSSEVLVLSWIYHQETAEVLWVGAKPGTPRERRKGEGVLAQAGSSLLEQGGAGARRQPGSCPVPAASWPRYCPAPHLEVTLSQDTVSHAKS